MYDYILVGGGLQNALIALLLLARRPGTTIALLEREERLGGNHTWSFHDSDVPEACRATIEPLIEHRWPGYRVEFNNRQRELELSYATISSPQLHAHVTAVLAAAPGCLLRTGVAVGEVTEHKVTLEDGSELTAQAVIDARGPLLSHKARPGCGFLKFLGLDVQLAEPVGESLRRPILMDAAVPQRDGFRFFYVLPFRPDCLLIEDNYYSDNRDFDAPALRKEVLAYAERRGWKVASVLREESGILPLPFRAAPPPPPSGPLLAGYRGGWFHPATSYSFPVVLRLAEHVASVPPAQLLGPGFAALLHEHRQQAAFCHRLNWLLFRGSPVAGRWRIMSGFYTHSEETLRRFYSMSLNAQDRSRILRTGAQVFVSSWLRGA
jgi:lycopene beta-cyclase